MRQTICFVHDRIVFLGGAEELLKQIIRGALQHNKLTLSPQPLCDDDIRDKEIVVYTLFSTHKTFVVDGYRFRIEAVWYGARAGDRYRRLLPLYPLLVWRLRRRMQRFGPQYVYISHFAVVKNCVYSGPINHLYIHSPMQYIREMKDEYAARFHPSIRRAFLILVFFLRKRDLTTKRSNIQTICANSSYTQACIHTIYNQRSSVMTPHTPPSFSPVAGVVPSFPYYIYIGRVVVFAKYVDRIIAACHQHQRHLLIVGSGPDEHRLRKKSSPYIHRQGQINDIDTKYTLLQHAQALINVTAESYGLVVAEAMMCGTPVIGRNGGATPFVTQGYPHVTLIEDRTPTGIINGIIAHESIHPPKSDSSLAHKTTKNNLE